MLHDLKNNAGKRSIDGFGNRSGNPSPILRPHSSSKNRSPPHHKNASTLSLPHDPYPGHRRSSAHSSSSVLKLSDLEPTALEIQHEVPDVTICCIVSFYPPTDFRRGRDEKRATNPHPEKNIPPILTNLFDKSYLHPKSGVDMSDPYLSPACATDEFLKAAYPEDIVLYTCEYDMLNVEGVEFGERLAGPNIGKKLHGGLIKGAPHAFDKKPNPISFPKAADRCYAEACAELKRVFGGKASVDERRQLEESFAVERFEAELPGDTVIGEHHDDDDDDDDDDVEQGIHRRASSLSAFRTKWKFKGKTVASEDVIVEEEPKGGA